ncbi:efflux RND transporter permease subunit [Marinococcus sp. PL1-022]|uniref:efflux RND transporter permease subunit n=1 Tax=Marinococcus sp. PL1-022 TaxID=3095363 RepID=UPI0029C20331|nr:efflux RND transporter permease subunit [Marinococcus sp. PL1-022]MDX6154534.1 efflux RND transporter permease subunit [Marinococcus sp. PL1-022]
MKLWNSSIKRPKFTIVVMIVLVLLGSVSLSRLPLQLFPNVEAPAAAVTTSYPGAGPEEVLNEVTEEVESDLSDISGVNEITSQSMEGSSIVIMEFNPGTEIDDVKTDIVSTISQTGLPDNAGSPSFLEFDPSMLPTIQMALSAGGDNVSDFQDQATEFQNELQRTEGVADISASGTLTEQFDVALDQAALEDNGLTQSAVVQAIQSQQATVPGGIIVNEDEQETISTRVISDLSSADELSSITVGQGTESGESIALSDVASVSLNTEEQNVITRVNQDPAIQMGVMKEADANTAQVSTNVNEEMTDLLDESQYDDLDAITLFDEGEFIQDSIDSVTTALISGGLLAMVVLFAFLRNLKTPLIIGIAIPFSVITTFALFFFTNISLNIMTLGGLALGIGMLVDNSIVVVENIYRHLSMKKTPKEAAADGTREVAGAITASTLTTVSIFLPVVFITGIAGDLFAPISIAIAFSLFASLFVAVTIVPMLASRLLKAPNENQENKRKTSTFMKKMGQFSRWTLRRRLVVLTITAVTFLIGALGLTTTGVEFLPSSDQGQATVEVEMEEGTALSRTEETVQAIEEQLDDESDVENYLSTIGSTAQNAGVSSESNVGEITVNLVNPDDRDGSTDEFVDTFSEDIEDIDEQADIQVQSAAQAGVGGEPNTYSFTIEDPNAERLGNTSEEVVEELESEDTIREVTSTETASGTELQANIDREAARDNGLAPAEIAQAVNAATNGESAGTITTDSNNTYSVNVQYNQDVLSNRENFESIEIPNQEGEYVQLSEVATIEEGAAPTQINQVDSVRSAEFTVLYESSAELSNVSETVNDVIDDVNLADNAEFVVGGNQEMINDLAAEAAIAFALGLAFIYLVMAAQFESFKQPLIIMFTVPLFVIGVMLSLVVTQKPISAMALIGVIVLAGIVVNNAIVLLDYVNQQKAKGMGTVEALVTSVQNRTRPILITTITTILGVFPLALGIGQGSETIQPMAIVIIGGLLSSTLLTLFVIPVIYSLFDKTTRHMNKKYLTPDGQIIYRREYLENSSHATSDETDTTSRETSDDEQPSEQTTDRSTYSEEEILDALENLRHQKKQSDSSKDDPNRS